MKKCVICNRDMDQCEMPTGLNIDDFINRHNICFHCLSQGADVQYLTDTNINLSDWEKQHIKHCRKCSKPFVQIWYLSMMCGICTIESNIKKGELEKKKRAKYEQELLLKQKEREQKVQQIMQKAPRPDVANARRDKKFRAKVPADMKEFCGFMSNIIANIKYGTTEQVRMYAGGVLYDFFINGLSQKNIELKYNISERLLNRIINTCIWVAFSPKNRWVFKPVQRLPKETKIQNFNQRVQDIEWAQSRIEY